jgi:hypothetical protein
VGLTASRVGGGQQHRGLGDGAGSTMMWQRGLGDDDACGGLRG